MERGGRQQRGRGQTQPARHSGRKSSSVSRGGSSGSAGRGQSPQPAGRGGGRGSRTVAPKIVAVPVPKKVAAVEDLAASAADFKLPFPQRLYAIQQLQKILATPAGRVRASHNSDAIVHSLMRLVKDKDQTLSTAAGACVAAWLSGDLPSPQQPTAASAATPAVDPASLFLDEALPLLAVRPMPGLALKRGILSPQQLPVVLVIIKASLAKVSGLTAFRRAGGVFTAVKAMLEDVNTPVDVLAPALEALLQALKVQYLNAESAVSLAETLITWAKRGELPAAARPALTRAMHAVSAVWEGSRGSERQQKAVQLVDEIVQRCAEIAHAAGDTTEAGENAGVVMNLTACVAALLVRGVNRQEESAMKCMPRLLSSFAEVVQMQGVPPSTVHELCSQANVFVLNLLKHPSASAPKEAQKSSERLPMPPPIVVLKPSSQSVETAANDIESVILKLELDASGLVSLDISPVTEAKQADPSAAPSALSAADQPSELQAPEESVDSISADGWQALTSAVHLACVALDRQDVRARLSSVGSLCSDMLSWINQVPKEVDLPTRVQEELFKSCLPPDGPLSCLRSSTNQAIVQPVARLYVHLLTRLPQVLHSFLDDISAAFGSDDALAASRELAFNVNVLLAAAKSGFSNAEDKIYLTPVWDSIVKMLGTCSDMKQDRVMQLAGKLIQIAQCALDQLEQGTLRESMAAQGLALSVQIIEKAPKWTIQMMKWQSNLISHVSEEDGEAVKQVFSSACGLSQHPDASVRVEAFSIIEAVIVRWESVLESQDVAASICKAAFTGLRDSDRKVAQHAQRVLQACSVSVSLSFLAGSDSFASEFTAGPGLQPGQAVLSVALESRQRALVPQQLSQVLDFLTGSSPSTAFSGAVKRNKKRDDESRGEGKHEEWMAKLVGEMEVVGEASSGDEKDCAKKGNNFTATSTRVESSFSDVAPWWLVLQTAAKQCVEGKLTTHWGGAAQTLSTLERAVQKMASPPTSSQSSNGTKPTKPSSTTLSTKARFAGSCLLHFLFALEQEMTAAISGSALRSPPTQTAALYYTSNKRVCEEWLARLRPAARGAAMELGLHHLAVYHALKRLENVKQRAAKSQAALKSAALSIAPVAGDKAAKKSSSTAADKSSKEKVTLLLQRSTMGQSSLQGPSPGEALLGGAHFQVREESATLKREASGAGKQPLLSASGTSAALEWAAADAVSALVSAVHALHDKDAILGAQAVCEKMFSEAQWTWMTAAALSAAGKYEEALIILDSVVGEVENAAGSVQKMSAALRAEAYAAVQDWDALQQWIKDVSPGRQQLPQPEAETYAFLAEWGLQSESLSSTVSGPKPPPQKLLLGNDSFAAALRVLGSAKLALEEDAGSKQSALESGAARIVQRILSRSILGEVGLSEELGSGLLAEDWAVLASLQIGARPEQLAKIAETPLLAPTLAMQSRDFSAWNNGEKLQNNPRAVTVAGRLLTSLEAPSTAASESMKCLSTLKLASAAGAYASNNLQWASKLLDSVEASRNDALRVALEASLELQKFQLTKQASSTPATSAIVAVLQRLVEEPQSAPALRVGLTAALAEFETSLAPESLLASVGSTQQDAFVWWGYAQCMYNIMQSSDGNAAAATQALVACCKAVSLCKDGSGGAVGQDVLPIMMMVLRLMTEHSAVLAEHCSIAGQRFDVTETLSQVPASAWSPGIPQLVSLLTTGSSEAVQAFAEVALQSAAAGDPAGVSLPILAELHRSSESGTCQYQSRALRRLGDKIKSRYAALCTEMEQFIDAVTQLALLENERWHSILLEAQGTLTKRLAAAYAHLKSFRGSNDPFTAAFVAAAREEIACAVAPVLAALKCHVAAAEAAAASTTTNRSKFYESSKFIPKLQWMIGQLEAPISLPVDSAAPAAGVLETALQRPLQSIKKVASEIAGDLKAISLSLESVFPAFLALKDSQLPVPGEQERCSSSGGLGAPCIASISAEIKVLHTKTRPKKIEILGTDGQTYAFLVKGREDLRIDLFVSNFMKAVSSALAVTSDGSDGLAAVLPLTVVPVAEKAGLVRWMDNTIPVYELYAAYESQRAQRTAWLAAAKAKITPAAAKPPVPVASPEKGGRRQKEALTKTQKKKAKKAEKEREVVAAAAAAAAAQAAAAVERPVRPADRFRAKIKAAGINTSTPRSTWPIDVLRSIYLDLAAAAPKSMIADELMTGAAGAAHWWSRQWQYTTSTAFMSILGYLLGLGDRHMDNILIQSDTGRVLHVDFGVLFDRGEKLAVPEIVPFRLTQSFVAGLGATGVEGRFRNWAEVVFKAVVQNEETFFSMLDFAANDPLIAWTPETYVRASRVAFERCAELAHFTRSMESSTATDTLSAAAETAGAALAQLDSGLSPYQKLFEAASVANKAVEEHQALVARCTETLEDAAVEESQLESAMRSNLDEIRYHSFESEAALKDVHNLERECTSSQNHYTAVLGASLDGRLAAAVTGVVSQWDPAVADVPLGLVQPYGPNRATLVGLALGLDPSKVPVTASLLLKAATVDDAGRLAFGKRAEAVQSALNVLEQYNAAVSAVNTDGTYPQLSQYARWLPALHAAAHQESQDPAMVLPNDEEEISLAIATWRVLRVHSAAADALLSTLQQTQETLKIERVDLGLAAEDSKEKTIAAIAGAAPAQVATALAEFTCNQAKTAEVLAGTTPGALVLDGLQQLVLGYATVVITARDAAGTAGADVSWLMDATSWLTSAVQVSDSIGSLAGELQLLMPNWAALFASASESTALEDNFGALEETLHRVCDPKEAENVSLETSANEVMTHLVEMSNKWPAVGSMLQCLQAVRTTSGSVPDVSLPTPPSAEIGSLNPVSTRLMEALESSAAVEPATLECLQLGATAVDLWQNMAAAWPLEVDFDLKEVDSSVFEDSWQQLSQAAASTVSCLVQFRLFPALHRLMSKTAQELFAMAEILPETLQQETLEVEGTLGADAEGSVYQNRIMAPATAESSQDGTIPHALPAFFNYLDEDESGMGEALEDSFDGSVELVDSLKMLGIDDDLESQSEQQELGSSGTSNADLLSCLNFCADTAGSLAAVDSVLHVTAMTAQHEAQQAQQIHAELAMHQWKTEPLLLTAMSPADLAVVPSDRAAALDSAAASDGASLLAAPNLSPPVATSRHDILALMKAAVTAIDTSEAEIVSWHKVAGPIQEQLAGELQRIAPQDQGNIRLCLDSARDWNADARAHTSALRDAMKTLLEFEGSRGLSTSENGIEKYREAVEKVHAVRAALLGVEREMKAAEKKLAELRESRKEANESLRVAEGQGMAVVGQLSKHAMPLVKATQKLPASLQDLDAAVQDLNAALETLLTAQRRLTRLQSCLGGPSCKRNDHKNVTEMQSLGTASSQTLSRALRTLKELPEALKKLQWGAQVAKRTLQQGGRGEAAAREQAGDIVKALGEAMDLVKPLIIDGAEGAAALADLPSILTKLVAIASSELHSICEAHKWDVNGWNSDAKSSLLVQSDDCLSSGHLYPPLVPGVHGSGSRVEEESTGNGSEFSEEVLRGFKRKLHGEELVEQGSGREAPSIEQVHDQVDAVIKQAMDMDNLAKMYEGWMPWI